MTNSFEPFRELKEQLKKKGPHLLPSTAGREQAGKLIVVLRQYRFSKCLSIELYNAGQTQEGKLKNPLVAVSPLDLIAGVDDAEELKFYAAISRFQNNPTMPRSMADIAALKTILNNPLALSFYQHNKDFSENIVAGSLVSVAMGEPVSLAHVWVNKDGVYYSIRLRFEIEGKAVDIADVTIKWDYFLQYSGKLYLLGHFSLVLLVQAFRQYGKGLQVPQAMFPNFEKEVLQPLEDEVSVNYTYIQSATEEQKENSDVDGRVDKLIYLSDLEPYAIINPVIRYGQVEIPVLSKKQIYITAANGERLLVQRNNDAEEAFTALLVRQHPYLWEQLEHDLPYFYLHRDRFLDEQWFLHAFDEWQRGGITVLGFRELKRNKYNGNKVNITINVTSGLDWFNTNISVRYGKAKASIRSVQHAVRNRSRYVQLDDGSMGILPAEWIDRLSSFFEAGEVQQEVLRTPKIAFDTLSEIYGKEFLDEEIQAEISQYKWQFSSGVSMEEVEAPVALQATLRPYQLQGLRWLNNLDRHNFGGILADDMGLGKSVQVIAFILLQRQKTAHNVNLLVVPTSLIFNWQQELKKFAPSISVHSLYGAGRTVNPAVFSQCEVVLTSYGTLLSDVVFLRKYKFNYIFLDESQSIKNISSQRYEAVKLLQARNRIVITGTPIENNTFDLYAQLSFACPGLLGGRQYFRDVYAIPIDKFKDRKRAMELQQKTAPFILRRTKAEVASDLPEKTEMILYCRMEEEQRNVYDRYETEFREYISAQDGEEIRKNGMHVLRGLTRLRQICNSPLLLQDEKTFSGPSSKIITLMEQIETKAPYHKILIFSQFVSMLDLLAKELDGRGVRFEYLTGATKDRKGAVDRFQEDESVRVFLISLKAGGVGLNLTAADYVYIVDPWWNPAVEQQAIDRSYRIGQHKNVMAVRLICPDTLEEKIQQLQLSKMSLSGDVIRSEEGLLPFLDKEEILSLVGA